MVTLVLSIALLHKVVAENFSEVYQEKNNMPVFGSTCCIYYRLLHAGSYVMGVGMSCDSSFLRFFKLQVESSVLSDCWHKEDRHILFPLLFVFFFHKPVRTGYD